MRIITQWVIRTLALGTIGAVLLGAAESAKADGITFQLTSTQLTTTSGGTITFDGTITNNSGVDLFASNFFFNFSAFDPVSVNPIQDLGVASDFLIPKGATSSVVALFDVMLGSVAAGSSFPVDILLEDINSDLSATQTVTVSVPGSVSVPEPGTLLLFTTGLAATFALLRKRMLPKN
jgi:hypothetical protein